MMLLPYQNQLLTSLVYFVETKDRTLEELDGMFMIYFSSHDII
jgi:hypothetical protein